MKYTENEKLMIIRQALVEASRIAQDNPPGDLGMYDPEMLQALMSTDKMVGWQNCFILKAIQVLEEKGDLKKNEKSN